MQPSPQRREQPNPPDVCTLLDELYTHVYITLLEKNLQIYYTKFIPARKPEISPCEKKKKKKGKTWMKNTYIEQQLNNHKASSIRRESMKIIYVLICRIY